MWFMRTTPATRTVIANLSLHIAMTVYYIRDCYSDVEGKTSYDGTLVSRGACTSGTPILAIPSSMYRQHAPNLVVNVAYEL